MSPSRWRNFALISSFLLLCLALLAACGNTPPQTQAKPTPSPTPGQGKQFLTAMARLLTNAQTLHGVFDLTITGRALNGSATTEIWNMAPNKNRTLVLQSTVSQIVKGAITVTDGKQLWQYDPVQDVVYNGPISATTTNGTPAGGSQSQFVLNLVQTIFTHSDGTIRSSTTINNHAVYDVHIVPQKDSAGAGAVSFNYAGEVYIDKSTQLPVRLNLEIVGVGTVLLDLPTFELNQTLPDSLFTFAPPAGAKVLPLRQATPTGSTGSLTLVQAQQQAGYHLLSIPGDQADYVLQGVNALGAPGNQIYVLNYMKGNLTFTISEGKSLANLPDPSGQQVNLRNTVGTISSANGTLTLAWTENGVGIHITGQMSQDQLVNIARLLS
ncbi:MAG TPA: hypothetical protein VFB60_25905 [Ktedonobacteraceae bacterium]|nr:hypothetical protein [Ktedonobacteraceae bacterium]